jgi:hypothetical protein
MSTPNPIAGMMQQAQQSLSNPIAQTVPQPQGIIDPSQHPVIGAILKALSGAAQSYGWTSMPPEQRLQAQQMEQQKAETMARMAQTAAYQQGELGYRRDMADVAQQNANSRQQDVASKEEQRKTANDIRQQQVDLATDKNEWMKEMASGRLDAAKTRISNQAAQFEKTFKLRAQQVGIEQAKLELTQQGLDIKKGFLDLAGVAMQQRGTAEGMNAVLKLQGLAYEHPVLSQVFGLDDVTKAVGEAKGAGIPGVAGAATPPTTGAPIQTPAPTNKVDAKRRQKAPPASSGQQFHYDAQGNRVAGPQ